MSKTEILEELPNLTKQERDEIRLKLTEIDGEFWLDSEELTTDEKALLDSRLAAYLKDPEAVVPGRKLKTAFGRVSPASPFDES